LVQTPETLMQKRLLLNLILLAVVAGLAALAFFEPGKQEPKMTRLAEIDDGAVNQITLQNKGTIVFERREGHWWLKSPFAAPANEIRIRQLLDIAKAESLARYPLKPEELAKFELDKPKSVLTLGSVKLIFGGSDPIGMRRYVQMGDTLHLVNDDFSHHLSASATDYVDKKLLPEDVKPNEIFLPGLKATLGQDGKWTLEPPSDVPARMTDLLNAWQSARAIEVKRIDQAPQGDIIRIGFPNQAPIEFVIVQREPDLLLARTDWGLQYLLAGESAKQLLGLKQVESGPPDKQPEGKDAPAVDQEQEEAEPETGEEPEEGIE
jgi:hypothetical protein